MSFQSETLVIIATDYNTGHNDMDIWIEHDNGINYVLEGAYYKFRGSLEILSDYANELLFEVRSWSDEDNGLKIANF